MSRRTSSWLPLLVAAFLVLQGAMPVLPASARPAAPAAEPITPTLTITPALTPVAEPAAHADDHANPDPCR